ncbi:histidine phosphatase family protein [Herbiconiux sp. SYSU D00978]|uniref:histidine phosphatase family protein n=1 Tax=Herbiconiux sp. SYSU D00978 TaxID=2812562 RepID=UPI001A97CA45|nr:histidine phosphatase family protein [Herbiconiux sp. SYSU D00978]
MTVTRLTLLRHGESEANVAAAEAERRGDERIAVPARDADVELTELGRRQAEATGRHLATLPAPQQVWVSPYVRARQTAAIALETAGFSPEVTVDERLRDRELGILDALTSRGVDALHPAEAERRRWHGKFYYRPPGGESWADVALRLRSLLRDLDDVDGEVLVVTHDAVVTLFRYVCERFEERPLLDEARANPMPNAALTRLARTAGGWTAESVNDVAHLAEITTHRGETDGTRV